MGNGGVAAAERQGLTCAYLPLADSGQLAPAMLEGLESLDLIAVDDVHAIAGDRAWEHSLFTLFNRCREHGTRLLFSADRGPAGYAVESGDGLLLVDSGSGTLGRLHQAGLDFRRLERVLYTHTHVDQQRNAQLRGRFHQLSDLRGRRIEFTGRHLEHQFIVHLHQQVQRRPVAPRAT